MNILCIFCLLILCVLSTAIPKEGDAYDDDDNRDHGYKRREGHRQQNDGYSSDSGDEDNRNRDHGYRRHGGYRNRDHDDYGYDEGRDRGHSYRRHNENRGYGDKRKDRKCGVQKAADPLKLAEQSFSGREKRASPNRLVLDRITGGTQISLSSDPTGGQLCWQAVVNSLDQFFCNGVIVGERTILTSATCVYNHSASTPTVYTPDNLFVQTGVRRIAAGNSWGAPTDLVQNCGREKFNDWNVKYVTVHPNFDITTYNNDIAIITLEGRLDFSKTCMCPICLEKKEPKPGYLCSVSGFGDDKNAINANPNFPYYTFNYLNVPVLDNVEGQCYFRSPATDPNLFICAGGLQGQDACAGDQGDPLACWDDEKQAYYLGGLFAIRARLTPDNPNVCGIGIGSQYTKIAHYYDWIIKNAYEDLDDY